MVISVSKSEQRRLHSFGAYFGVPLILGFAVGVHQGGFGRYFSLWGSLVVWEVHFLIFWACCMAAAALLSTLPRVDAIPVLARLLVSAGFGAAISRPIFWVTYQLRAAYAMQLGASAEAVSRPIQIFELSPEFALLMVELYGPNILIWTVCCLAISKYVPIPFVNGAGEVAAVDTGTRSEELDRPGREADPAWLSRVKPEIGRKLRWLKAEGHYVQVNTALGTDLIHYRLSDAVEQLAGLGLQVHRSYWLSYEALRDPTTRIESGSIRLGPNEVIPIGQTYLVKVREAQGWSGSSPEQPTTRISAAG
jgi:hypothetical protein